MGVGSPGRSLPAKRIVGDCPPKQTKPVRLQLGSRFHFEVVNVPRHSTLPSRRVVSSLRRPASQYRCEYVFPGVLDHGLRSGISIGLQRSRPFRTCAIPERLVPATRAKPTPNQPHQLISSGTLGQLLARLPGVARKPSCLIAQTLPPIVRLSGSPQKVSRTSILHTRRSATRCITLGCLHQDPHIHSICFAVSAAAAPTRRAGASLPATSVDGFSPTYQ